MPQISFNRSKIVIKIIYTIKNLQ